MQIYNTLTRRKEPLEPIEPGRVGLYTCGPTVYNYAHIGNYRAYMFEDILRRTIKLHGFDVTQVMNLTDVDDKTIRGAIAAGKALKDYTAPFIEAFFEDLKTLSIEPAEVYPAATDHIPEMITLIERLIERELAYVSEDGSVYYAVSKFPGYGKLAHLKLEGLQAGARVAQDEYEKEHVGDFALWKAWDQDDGDVAWESPWGRGRPGWHIECSAMGMKYLGETFDLHTGGVDNMFPHHENEIAQSEGATGKPFVRYWMHNAHLRVNGEKMSKSLGNFFTLRDIIERGSSGREIRYVLINGHYRQTLNFTFAALDAARASLARLDEFMARVRKHAGDATSGEIPPWAVQAENDFRTALGDDLNVPEGLAALFGLVGAGNRALDAGTCAAAEAVAVQGVLERMDSVLGVLAGAECAVARDPAVDLLLEQRAGARAARDWAESDRVRDALAELGWTVRDTPEGQQLKPRSA